jgi:hypothetical protein
MPHIPRKARDRPSSYISNGLGCCDDKCSVLLGGFLLELWSVGFLLIVGGLSCNRSMLG